MPKKNANAKAGRKKVSSAAVVRLDTEDSWMSEMGSMVSDATSPSSAAASPSRVPGQPTSPDAVATDLGTLLEEDEQSRQPTRERAQYTGPRPDEELLHIVHAADHEATEGDYCSVEHVYQLLRTDEDVNQRSMLGLTPLAVAAINSNGPLVALLLERHANVELRSVHNNELPLHYAARAGNRVVCQLIAEPTARRGLIDSPNLQGWPPLHVAVASGHVQCIGVLVRQGANMSRRNEPLGGSTALHIAVRYGLVDAAEALLDRDANVMATDDAGRGALHFAAARGDYKCVGMLLRNKADTARRDAKGKLAQDLVPLEAPDREKLLTLLAAFHQKSPSAWRTDLRFDIADVRDLDAI